MAFFHDLFCKCDLSQVALPALLESTNQWSSEEETIFWTILEDNGFCEGIFEKIVVKLPRKNLLQIREHMIENIVEFRKSQERRLSGKTNSGEDKADSRGEETNSGGDQVSSEKRRRRGTGEEWTDEEKRLFQEGRTEHGWGSWKEISENNVKTRTPTQVGSYAQKLKLREKSVAQQNVQSTSRSSKKLLTSSKVAPATAADMSGPSSSTDHHVAADMSGPSSSTDHHVPNGASPIDQRCNVFPF
uniref:HTH myb-type domain-containing protein n=1 Tax=Fagus sylvatica TaxID=28930 RepID=A0A2N9J1D8_FAGSY